LNLSPSGTENTKIYDEIHWFAIALYFGYLRHFAAGLLNPDGTLLKWGKPLTDLRIRQTKWSWKCQE
jgi:hypothetical protein